MRAFVLVLLMLMTGIITTPARANDYLAHVILAQAAADTPDDDFAPMLFFMMLGFFVICLVLVGIGIAIGAFGIVLISALIVFGIISSSVAVGLLHRRLSAGWRAFLMLTSVALSMPCGIMISGLAHHFAYLPLQSWRFIAVGATAGAVAGVLIALTFDWILRVGYTRLARYLTKPS